ncbi:uncharacterized protein GIQ15_04083 [Arthroderma uncinatum]|uniref:uncharacterized protein n=1 Tax=Arthroderma uncinatum TaxID=74035 RepID=UPI00144ABDF0|nr:uncharacterized protein GIQ15_04083 [Arthroderma uncinatum]KAF3481324.1 hypothetical protein GIQ15_04083 [Arthroderma uncinatum]
MKSTNSSPILIIGAGLSGLATGRLLTNHGIPNIVFESSTPDRSQGFAISLHDWGYTPLLEALGGLSLRTMIKAVAPDRHVGGSGWVDLAMRDNSTGNVLVAPEASARPAVMRANRNALRSWISDCGDLELDVRYGHKLKSVTGTVGNVKAVFENGSQYQGSLIVAADGVYSAEVVPVVVYHGEFQLSREDFDRFVKPISGDSNILAGVGDGFNTPITICNITKTQVHLDWSYSRPARGNNDPLFSQTGRTQAQTSQLPQALLDELASRKLAEPWSRFINPETIKQHSVFHWISRCVYMTSEDARRGAQQGVVFVGDSWHAMPIFGGEGGNHALVDSVEFTAAVTSNSDLEKAVAAYYDGSIRRCQDAVRRSRSRFYVLHRPMAEWQDIAEKRRLKATQPNQIST